MPESNFYHSPGRYYFVTDADVKRGQAELDRRIAEVRAEERKAADERVAHTREMEQRAADARLARVRHARTQDSRRIEVLETALRTIQRLTVDDCVAQTAKLALKATMPTVQSLVGDTAGWTVGWRPGSLRPLKDDLRF